MDVEEDGISIKPVGDPGARTLRQIWDACDASDGAWLGERQWHVHKNAKAWLLGQNYAILFNVALDDYTYRDFGHVR